MISMNRAIAKALFEELVEDALDASTDYGTLFVNMSLDSKEFLAAEKNMELAVSKLYHAIDLLFAGEANDQ